VAAIHGGESNCKWSCMWGDPLNSDTSAVLLNTKFEVYGADQVHPGDTGFDIIAGVEATIGSIIPDPKRFSLQCAQSRMTWSAPELGTTITHVFPSLPRPPD
jgi:hypothetical protein